MALVIVVCNHCSAQAATDDNFQMSFVTYAQQHIVLNCKSKSTCDGLEVRMKWAKQDTTLYFNAQEQRQVMLPFSGGDVIVQAKTVTNCNVQSNGPWINISLAALSIRESNLPIKQKPVRQSKVRVVAMNGSSWKEMTNEQFQQEKYWYRQHYYILRDNKAKEVML